MTTDLVLDTLEMAIWSRRQDGIDDLAGLVHHSDAGSQYTSIAFTQRLIEAGVDASVGSVGDAYDNALAESLIGALQDRAHPTPTGPGATSTTSSSTPCAGWTGTTPSARTSPSTTSPRYGARRFTTLPRNRLLPPGRDTAGSLRDTPGRFTSRGFTRGGCGRRHLAREG